MICFCCQWSSRASKSVLGSIYWWLFFLCCAPLWKHRPYFIFCKTHPETFYFLHKSYRIDKHKTNAWGFRLERDEPTELRHLSYHQLLFRGSLVRRRSASLLTFSLMVWLLASPIGAIACGHNPTKEYSASTRWGQHKLFVIASLLIADMRVVTPVAKLSNKRDNDE